MTIRQIIDLTDLGKENAIDTSVKVRWIAELDGKIAADVFLMGYSELKQFAYTEDNSMDTEPLVSFPHDDIYRLWLMAQIDLANGEYNKYQNTMVAYNESYGNFLRWFARVWEPAQGSGCFSVNPDEVQYYITAYGLAVKAGFVGTVDEWLKSLKGPKGDVGDITPELEQLRQDVINEKQAAQAAVEAARAQADIAAQEAGRAEKAAQETEEALLTRAEGRSSNYRLSSSGWKRIFIGIRGHSGTMNLSLGCNNTLGHMVQNIALGYSMFADWPSSKVPNMAGQGTYPGGGPKVWQIANHYFGEDPAQVNLSQIYRIDKVRVAYPINCDTTTDADTSGQYQNPVNCYLDIHVAGDVRLLNGSPLVQLMANIIGKSDNHNTYAITEETNAPVDAEGYVLGAFGEKCAAVEFMLHEDSAYSVDEPSRFKELLAEKTLQLTQKSINTEHFVEDDLYDVRRLTVPVAAAEVSKIGIRASRKVNMVPAAMQKFGIIAGAVKVEQVGNGLFRLTGTANGNAIAKIYEYAQGDVPILLKKGVTYYASGIQLYYNTAAMETATRKTASGYTDGSCMVTKATAFTPTQDMYVQRISVYINKGNIYDGHLYYPQISTDASAIVSDLQTGAIRAEYDAYATEQTALGKLPLHYVSWLDRKLGADRYSPSELWINAGGVQATRAVIDFADGQLQLWDDAAGTVAVVDDPYIPLYRREIARASALSFLVQDVDGGYKGANGSAIIEGTVKESTNAVIANLQKQLSDAVKKIATLENRVVTKDMLTYSAGKLAIDTR